MLARLALVSVLVLAIGTPAAPVSTSAPDRAHPAATTPSVPGASSLAAPVEVPVGLPGTPEEPPADPDADVTFTEVDVVVPSAELVEEGLSALGEIEGPGEVVADRALGDRVETDVIETDDFQTLGVTWPADEQVDSFDALVRTRSGDEWSPWVELELSDAAADVGTPDAEREVRGGTDPVWVGEADAVQLSFAATDEGGPDDLRLALVSSAPLPPDDAVIGLDPDDDVQTVSLDSGLLPAAAPVPSVISRSQWGAAPQVCTPNVASTLVGAVVHHTAGSNSYATVDQAKQQIRNDQRYHIEGRGWCDIGYNFIVDKWGNIYEGRASSGSKAVVGVHAGGFNTGTVGISMLGSYGDVTPPAAVQESVAKVVAWRLGAYHRDPAANFTYNTLGGQNSKYPSGSRVTLPRVFAHRDVAYTACPGLAGYATLPHLRNRARSLIGTTFVNPAATPVTAPAGSTVTVRATTIGNINWRLTVTDARTGDAVASSIGYAQQSLGGVRATWDGKDSSGRVVDIGDYRLRLTGTDSSGAAVVPFTATVQLLRDPNPPTVAAVPLVANLNYVPIPPTRVLDTRDTPQPVGPASRLDVVVAGTGGVPADAKAVAVNVTVVEPTAVTHVRAWPAGQNRPTASVLNGDTTRSASAAGVTLGVGGEGKISLYNNAGLADLVVDVTGYYTTSSGLGYAQLPTASRVLDTRKTGGTMSDGQRRTVTVAGRNGIPADAAAVVMNVTSVRSAGNGHVTVVPAGTAKPTTSSVNHLPRKDVANLTTVPLAGGKVDVLLAGASANVVLDVVGWFGPGETGQFTPITPARAFDTRTSSALGAGQSRTFAVGGKFGVPADALGVVATVTATEQSAVATYLTAWPAGQSRPGTSNLNTGRGRDQANSAVVGLGTSGGIRLYNNIGSTHVVGDVYGFYR